MRKRNKHILNSIQDDETECFQRLDQSFQSDQSMIYGYQKIIFHRN